MATKTISLREEAYERLRITVTTAGELGARASPEERKRWEELLGHPEVLSIDLEVCWRYGRIFSCPGTWESSGESPSFG